MDAPRRTPLRLHDDQRSIRVAITGVGLITSTGGDRESAWRAAQAGRTAVARVRGVPDLPDDLVIGAVVDLGETVEHKLKVIEINERVVAEATADSGLDLAAMDRTRVGCAVSAHYGDSGYFSSEPRPPGAPAWWEQFFPDTACSRIAAQYDLHGPTIAHSTACSSGLVDFLAAARRIRDGHADVMFASSAEAIDPLFAAGFHRMRVLAEHDDPRAACRPFDRDRRGFVMGEGGAAFVLERLDHALARGATIYGEVAGGAQFAEAYHVTGLDSASDGLVRLIDETLRRSGVRREQIGYISAHATGTEQNDRTEMLGIRRAFGDAADQICVSGLKAMLGHLVNASGGVELALTTLALRDGFLPPTLNLDHPDPLCRLDCLPHQGRSVRPQYAMKLSLAFGGHLVAAVVRRWPADQYGFAYPSRRAA